jgi:serine/threonine protein kinase
VLGFLDELSYNKQELTLHHVVKIACNIASPLLALKELNYTHSNITPETVLVEPDGDVTLLDMGQCIAGEDMRERRSVHRPRLRAPELESNRTYLIEPSPLDVWGLGTVMVTLFSPDSELDDEFLKVRTTGPIPG